MTNTWLWPWGKKLIGSHCSNWLIILGVWISPGWYRILWLAWQLSVISNSGAHLPSLLPFWPQLLIALCLAHFRSAVLQGHGTFWVSTQNAVPQMSAWLPPLLIQVFKSNVIFSRGLPWPPIQNWKALPPFSLHYVFTDLCFMISCHLKHFAFYWFTYFDLFTRMPLPWGGDICLFRSLLYLNCLGQCLAHSRCLGNTWVSEECVLVAFWTFRVYL